jgi:pimeloyl-ACP methyl ester carboxylesterase
MMKIKIATLAIGTLLGAVVFPDDARIYKRSFYVWTLVANQAHGGQRANVNDVSIYYETYGAGLPVLVLHGGLGSHEGMSNQIMALAASHYVIAPDSRGHGRSTDSDAILSYSAMADDMLKVLDSLRIDRVDVVGWSDGGIIGLDLAMRYPDRIRRLVAISANYDVGGLIESSNTVERTPRRPLRYALFAPDPAHWPTLYRKVATMWQTQPHYTLRDLRRIKASTLIMAGERDVIKRDHTDELTKSIARSQEVIIEGGTHAVVYENHQVVNSQILMFLDGGNK